LQNAFTDERMRREPPYAFYFFLLIVIIFVLSLWVIWNETVTLRPWKSYQARYYELKQRLLEDEYEKALEDFQSPETQQKYNELKALVKEAEEDFQNSEVQEKYIEIKTRLDEVREMLRGNQTEFQAARGKALEREYLFTKHQREEDRVKMAEYEEEVEKIEERRRELLREEEALKVELSEYTVEAERLAAEIRGLEMKLTETRERLKRIDGIPIEIKQVYMEDINKADRCQSCHIGIDSPEEISNEQPFTRHPGHFIYLENHPPNVFGCTFCHRGQGRATSSPDKAHGWVEYWPEPMLRGNAVQATCQTCHGEVQHLRGGNLLAKGSKLVEKYGCYGCHKIAGYEDLRKVGPELTKVATKVNYTWMVDWLQDPKGYVESARMPKYFFSQEHAEEITDYLFSMTREDRIDYPVGEINWDLADRGKILWRQSRCSICHPANGVGGAFKEIGAPDLGKIGSKVNREWLYKWIKDPKSYFPTTKMPRFRFTDDDIWDLVEYIMSEYVNFDFEPEYAEPVAIEVESIKRGKKLVQNYGCFGCHNVKGMEEMKEIGPFLRRGEVTYLRIGEVDEKIGAELSSVGNKPLELFEFGKMAETIPHDRISFIKQKLRDPRSFRDDLRMPNYRFSEDEIDALATLLVGFSDTAVPTRFKVPKEPSDYKPTGEFAKIESEVKCLNCHSIRGKGNDFAPDISIEGSKVQEQWLHEFLKQPDIIRPMLRQMPQFGLDYLEGMIKNNLTYSEIETIIQYFKNVLVTHEIPERLPEGRLSPEDQIKAGRSLYEEKGCRACHQIGVDGGAVGPNLTNVGKRLTEGYIYKYLDDPQSLVPDVIEPNYEFTGEERVNLTRYLMTLKEG